MELLVCPYHKCILFYFYILIKKKMYSYYFHQFLQLGLICTIKKKKHLKSHIFNLNVFIYFVKMLLLEGVYNANEHVCSIC